MDREKMIDGWGKELARVRSQMDELGPIAVGTLSRSTKKYRTKDGAEHTCSDSAVLKFAGAGKNLTVRVPGDKEKAVRKLLENGRKWRELSKRHLQLSSRLAVYGALKKTTRDADAEVREPSGDSRRGKRTGDGRRVGKGRGAA